MTEEEKLLPCPFCGIGAEKRQNIYWTHIRCSNDRCISRGPLDGTNHETAAVIAWNRRAEK